MQISSTRAPRPALQAAQPKAPVAPQTQEAPQESFTPSESQDSGSKGLAVAKAVAGLAVGAGIGIYYMQEYAYYEPVAPVGDDVTLVTPEGEAEAIPVEGFEAIDAPSEPNLRHGTRFGSNGGSGRSGGGEGRGNCKTGTSPESHMNVTS